MPESTCRGCGLNFTAVSSFDDHQEPIDEPPHVRCLDPREVGLQAKVRTAGGKRRVVWGKPGPNDIPWSSADALSSPVSVDGGVGDSEVATQG